MMALLRALLFRRTNLLLDVAPALVCLAGIMYLGLIPLKRLPDPGFFPADKFWHAVAFAVFALLLFRALQHFLPSVLSSARIAALGSSLVGALLEVLQSLSAYRSAEVLDLVADVAGALVAMLFLNWMRPRSDAELTAEQLAP
jgi:VanZ family protein